MLLNDAQHRGADYGAELLQKGADIGAHKFAAHGHNLPRFAAKLATFAVSPPIRDRHKALTCRGLRDAIAIEKGAYVDA